VHTGSTSSPQVHYCTTSAEHRMQFVVLYCNPDDGCGYTYNYSHQVHMGSDSSPQVHYSTTSAEHRMRFVVLYCTPDDGHNDA
jgi:uncharacterized protein YlbG (UPF0298 family)